ncbi:3-hydroxybutyrate oligomer hydrolase family protein, partial [Pantoea sp. SIMBA_133]
MKRIMLCALIGATGLTLSACKDNPPFNEIPDFIQGDISQTSYDGLTDALLTAGLGASGLASAPGPAFA